MELTLQIHWNNRWHDAGLIRFVQPEKGLSGKPMFSYSADYAVEALEWLGDFEARGLIDKTAVGINLPCHLGGDYLAGEIAPVLRDIIPQGAGRQHWLKMLGYERDPEQAIDTRLLAEGCIAPIGNLRIKEAADAFAVKLSQAGHSYFSAEEVCARADKLVEHAQAMGVAIGGATGAGGDAPKLLIVENQEGKFALEGTVPPAEIRKHWLVKFPRGRKTRADVAVLQGEAAIYRALETRGFNTGKESRLDEQEGQFALWLPRFDREVVDGKLVCHGVESVYSVMGRIGDGTGLDHAEVITKLQTCVTTPANPDRLLADYLVRDVLNTAIGNRDNHGRNTSIIKRDRHIELSPAYDLAPMILDPDAIARTTLWPRELRSGTLEPDYPAIINALSVDADEVTRGVTDQLDQLRRLKEELAKHGAPEEMLENRAIEFDAVEKALDQLSHPHPAGPRR
ncbi:MAG: HipA domain-containing protein [Marinobacter sp.]|nr:HipA domain-containing protein [Marinobacter sp.]